MSTPIDNLPPELFCTICESLEPSHIDLLFIDQHQSDHDASKTTSPPSLINLIALFALCSSSATLCFAATRSLNTVRNTAFLRLDMRINALTGLEPGHAPVHTSYGMGLLAMLGRLEIIIPCLFRLDNDIEGDHAQIKNFTMNFFQNDDGFWVLASQVWETTVPPVKFGKSLLDVAVTMDLMGALAVDRVLPLLNTLDGDDDILVGLFRRVSDLAIDVWFQLQGQMEVAPIANPVWMLPIVDTVASYEVWKDGNGDGTGDEMGQEMGLKVDQRLGWRGRA